MPQRLGTWLGAMLLALVAACTAEPGLLIEVVPGSTSTTAVELFLVVQPCESCGMKGMGLPAASERTAGPIWYVDSPTRLAATVGSDGVARFQLQPGTTSTLSHLLAVGLDESGHAVGFAELRDVTIPASTEDYWQVRLAATQYDAATPNGLVPGDRVQLWDQPGQKAAASAHQSCVAILHQDGTGDFFSPSDDPDCDGITERECDPFWYTRNEPMPTTACLTPKMDGVACMLGTPTACVDGVGPATCTAVPFCLPDALCASCDGLVDPSCVAQQTANPATTRLACTIPVEMSATGTYVPCTLANASVGAVTLLHNYISGCTEVGFLTAANPGASFSTSHALPGATNAVIYTESPTSGCTFNLGFQGILPTLVSDTAVFTAKINSGTAQLALPIHVEFTTDCAQTVACEIVPADPVDDIWRCGQ